MAAELELWNTYYKTISEIDYTGTPVTIHRTDGSVLASVPRPFAYDLFIEGAGILKDGRVVNTTGTKCSYGEYFKISESYSGHQCYATLKNAPWGVGVSSNPLIPFRTIAVDQSQTPIPYKSWVYIKEFDGVMIPRVGGPYGFMGGFKHDGLFYAGDTGSMIKGNHIDIFVGPASMERAIAKIVPSHSKLNAVIGVRPPKKLTFEDKKPLSLTAAKVVVGVGVAAMGVMGAILWRGRQP